MQSTFKNFILCRYTNNNLLVLTPAEARIGNGIDLIYKTQGGLEGANAMMSFRLTDGSYNFGDINLDCNGQSLPALITAGRASD